MEVCLVAKIYSENKFESWTVYIFAIYLTYWTSIFKDTCYLVWILVQRQRSNRELPCQVTTFLGENTQGLLNQIPFIFPYSEFGLHYSFSPRNSRCKKKQNCIEIYHAFSLLLTLLDATLSVAILWGMHRPIPNFLTFPNYIPTFIW